MKPLAIVIIVAFFFAACEESGTEDPAGDCTDSDLEIHLLETVPSSACEIADGIIRVAASKGNPPYTFFLNSTARTDSEITGVPAGIHSIQVKDTRGCTATLANVSLLADGLSFSVATVPDTDCTAGNGAFTINVQNGQLPLLFSLEQGVFGEENSFDALIAGEYSVVVKDGTNCLSSLRITVPRGSTGTSWKDTIRPLIETHCSTTGCHNGITRPDLRNYEKASFYAGQMKTLTADRSMPFTGSLTQEQIDLIGCWVDDGAPDN